MDIRYQIFDPSGNITALVEGDRFTPEERIRINDAIMAKHADVEQVGFLSTGTPEMTMAGGEFCGNATRSSILAYLLQLPLFIPIVGFIYFIEVLSVIIQVGYFKKTHGKRIFRMAPIHHHFELGGWSEVKVVAVFTIITVILGAVSLLGLWA